MNLNVNQLVAAIVGANGSIAVAVERLNRKYPSDTPIDAETLIEQLANEPVAAELISKQFKVKALLTTYNLLMVYQAELAVASGDEKNPLSQAGVVQGFTAISNLFGKLTETYGQQTNINIFDKVLAAMTPEARDAFTMLAEPEPILPAPTPIRKRGRPSTAAKLLEEAAE